MFQHFDLAKKFEQLLTTDGRFEIVNDVQFGLVCFRLKVNIKTEKYLFFITLKKLTFNNRSTVDYYTKSRNLHIDLFQLSQLSHQ